MQLRILHIGYKITIISFLQISLGDEGGAGGETGATESTNTRFFGAGNNCGGGGFNQGFNQGGFNQGGGFGGQGFNQGGFSQGGFNQGGGQGFNQGGFNQGFNQGGFNQGGRCPCRCSNLAFTGPQGQREGACQSRDNTGEQLPVQGQYR